MPKPVKAVRGPPWPKLAMPEVAKAAKDEAPKVPAVKIAGNFGQWMLVCGEVKDQAGQEPCSLVQALVEHESQKLVFRLTVAYGPRGNLVLRIDSPKGGCPAEGPRILARCDQDLPQTVVGRQQLPYLGPVLSAYTRRVPATGDVGEALWPTRSHHGKPSRRRLKLAPGLPNRQTLLAPRLLLKPSNKRRSRPRAASSTSSQAIA